MLNTTVHASKKVASCSEYAIWSQFDPGVVIQHDLKSRITLTNLGWPETIGQEIQTMEHSFKIMSILFCIGAISMSLTLAIMLWGIFTNVKFIFNITTSLVRIDPNSSAPASHVFQFAFFTLLIASIIAKTIIDKTGEIIIQHGRHVGAMLEDSQTFIDMTWSATILMLFSNAVWIFGFPQ